MFLIFEELFYIGAYDICIQLWDDCWHISIYETASDSLCFYLNLYHLITITILIGAVIYHRWHKNAN